MITTRTRTRRDIRRRSATRRRYSPRWSLLPEPRRSREFRAPGRGEAQMSFHIKAHYFWVCPGVPKHLEDFAMCIKETAGLHAAFLFTDPSGNKFTVDELEWNEQDKIVTGTIGKHRRGNHPVTVSDQPGLAPIPIDEDEDIAEVVCFALCTTHGETLFQASRDGPTVSALRTAIRNFGFPHAVVSEPLFRQDMAERFDEMKLVRSLEFHLSDPMHGGLANADGNLSPFISGMNGLGGLEVTVVVTVGRKRKASLIKDVVDRVTKFLMAEAHTEVAPVTKLKVKGKESEDLPTQELDLLHLRCEERMVVNQIGRVVDRTDCQQQLRQKLRAKLAARGFSGQAPPWERRDVTDDSGPD